MRPIAIASPKRARKLTFDFALAPLIVAITAAASSVRTMGLANCDRMRFSAPSGGAVGSSFAPSRSSRVAASASSRPRTGSAPRRWTWTSTAPLWCTAPRATSRTDPSAGGRGDRGDRDETGTASVLTSPAAYYAAHDLGSADHPGRDGLRRDRVTRRKLPLGGASR